MKTLWRKNQENSSDRISHAWAPLNYGNNEKKSNVFALKIWNKHKEKLMYSLLKYQ